MKMKLTWGIAIALLALIASYGSMAQGLQPGFELPESVESDGKRFFVSNIGGAKISPGNKDGDGFISEISAEGKIITKKFLPQTGVLHSPTGLALVGNVLYVADIDRIVGFDILSRKIVFELNFASKAGLLNDLVKVDSHRLLVSDIFKNHVSLVDLTKKSVTALKGTVNGANGLAYDARRGLVYLVNLGTNFDGSGQLYVKSLKDPEDAFKPLPNSPTGVLDGISFLDESHLIISDWVNIQAAALGTKGKLFIYDLLSQQYKSISLAVQSPADFFLDAKARKLFIPITLEGKVMSTTWDELSKATEGKSGQADGLFHAGVASAFIGGLYDGFYSYASLKQHGDFGLGAPDHLDGEITILNGKVYQTQHTGKTFEVADTGKTSFAFVNFFHPDRIISLPRPLTKAQLFHYLDSTLQNLNGMYAIRLMGSFTYVKTRAFPPITQRPYAPLATLLDRQHFFEYQQTSGDLIGFRLPSYLEGINIPGYHFHFLSASKDAGGHIIDFILAKGEIQIHEISRFSVEIPFTEDFKAFDFIPDKSADLRRIENAGAQK
jgi:alpha-acetolactate decarboxylase